jgi:hypothetical protein
MHPEWKQAEAAFDAVWRAGRLAGRPNEDVLPEQLAAIRRYEPVPPTLYEVLRGWKRIPS